MKLGVFEVKTKLSELLDRVERDGETVIITRNGRPIADLKPHTEVAKQTRADVIARILLFAGAHRFGRGRSLRAMIGKGRL
jgi:prevent-host-death family protein